MSDTEATVYTKYNIVKFKIMYNREVLTVADRYGLVLFNRWSDYGVKKWSTLNCEIVIVRLKQLMDSCGLKSDACCKYSGL